VLIGALDVFELSEKVARVDEFKVKKGNLRIFQTKNQTCSGFVATKP
tara:strand:- start:2172 stop:2312 length:141 start_codon:yes stop_codon:yes gene_type:complete